MKLVIQRVNHAQVEVEDKVVGKIRKRFFGSVRSNTWGYKRRSRLFSKKALQIKSFQRWKWKNEFRLKDS